VSTRARGSTGSPRAISIRRLRVAAIAAVFAIAPRVALACPVCFGDNDSPLAKAMNLGIMAMLVVVVGVLGAFASFFIYLIRRQKFAASITESDPAQAGRYREGEGTA
jgi:hypothetical protein